MTDEQINIKIAELCGWTPADEQEIRSRAGNAAWLLRRGPWWRNAAEKTVATVEELPNYAGDLNACHEFEKTLEPMQHIAYDRHLHKLVDETVTWKWHATARQRCEAFLRVHGQWEEEA